MIRKVERKDTDAVKKLFTLLTGKDISTDDVNDRIDLVESSNIDWLYLYELEGRTVGLLGFRIRENIEEKSRYGEVSVLVVDPEFRRKGIGKKLMEYAEELAQKNGCVGTWLVSGFVREEKAHNFYRSLGYITTGYRFVKRK